MKIAQIKTNDIADGEGVRTSVFVSGCRHHCKGCFNEIAWDFEYGREYNKGVEEEILKSVEPAWIAGITLLGGEPFEPENCPGMIGLVKEFKKRYPQKTVWCYSGFTIDELAGIKPSRVKTEEALELLQLVDILVDGEYVEEKKNISLKFRGSENQRVIDVKKTLAEKQVVLYLD